MRKSQSMTSLLVEAQVRTATDVLDFKYPI
jgi:hypothetical protein